MATPVPSISSFLIPFFKLFNFSCIADKTNLLENYTPISNLNSIEDGKLDNVFVETNSPTQETEETNLNRYFNSVCFLKYCNNIFILYIAFFNDILIEKIFYRPVKI